MRSRCNYTRTRILCNAHIEATRGVDDDDVVICLCVCRLKMRGINTKLSAERNDLVMVVVCSSNALSKVIVQSIHIAHTHNAAPHTHKLEH